MKKTYDKKVVFLFFIIISILLLIILGNTGYVVKEKKEITINAYKWGFDPNVIYVEKDDSVRLRLITNESKEQFGFKLSGYMYNNIVLIEPGIEKYYDFKAYKKGIFIYRCEKYCGWGRNSMNGILVVE